MPLGVAHHRPMTDSPFWLLLAWVVDISSARGDSWVFGGSSLLTSGAAGASSVVAACTPSRTLCTLGVTACTPVPRALVADEHLCKRRSAGAPRRSSRLTRP